MGQRDSCERGRCGVYLRRGDRSRGASQRPAAHAIRERERERPHLPIQRAQARVLKIVRRVATALRDRRVLPGGGAPEILCALALRRHAEACELTAVSSARDDARLFRPAALRALASALEFMPLHTLQNEGAAAPVSTVAAVTRTAQALIDKSPAVARGAEWRRADWREKSDSEAGTAPPTNGSQTEISDDVLLLAERWIAHDCAPPLACINKPEQSSHSGGSTVAVYDSYSAKMAMLRRAAEIAELVLRTDFVG